MCFSMPHYAVRIIKLIANATYTKEDKLMITFVVLGQVTFISFLSTSITIFRSIHAFITNSINDVLLIGGYHIHANDSRGVQPVFAKNHPFVT